MDDLLNVNYTQNTKVLQGGLTLMPISEGKISKKYHLVVIPILDIHFQFMLLHYQADVNIQDSDGNTPLHLSTSHGHEDVSLLFLY